MRFDIGTLDSGERSLPFGLRVFLSVSKDFDHLFCRLVSCLQCRNDYDVFHLSVLPDNLIFFCNLEKNSCMFDGLNEPFFK